MKPSDLSKELLRIANAIEKSKNPSKKLVLKDLKSVYSKIAALEDPETDVKLNEVKAQIKSSKAITGSGKTDLVKALPVLWSKMNAFQKETATSVFEWINKTGGSASEETEAPSIPELE